MSRVRMWPLDANDKTNAYIELIKVRGITYSAHSWKKFYDLSFDVFHMHWPETYLNEKSIFVRMLGSMVVIFYLFYIKIMNKKVIWTVHNLKPHDYDNEIVNNLFYKLCILMTDELVFLSDSSKNEFLSKYSGNYKYSKILHPYYPAVRIEEKYNTQYYCGFLFFGMIRPYKNLENLIDLFKTLNGKYNLNVIGSCEKEYEKYLLKRAEGSGNINFIFGRYTEVELQKYLDNCDGVLIPYQNITNSGVIYRVISCGAPIIAPKINYTEECLSFYSDRTVLYDKEISCCHLDKMLKKKSISNFEINVDYYNNNIKLQHGDLYSRHSCK